nr:MAG TPA: hypothetical protein [Caudoviricetes sp.]
MIWFVLESCLFPTLLMAFVRVYGSRSWCLSNHLKGEEK